jgi:WD40 repeat protein
MLLALAGVIRQELKSHEEEVTSLCCLRQVSRAPTYRITLERCSLLLRFLVLSQSGNLISTSTDKSLRLWGPVPSPETASAGVPTYQLLRTISIIQGSLRLVSVPSWPGHVASAELDGHIRLYRVSGEVANTASAADDLMGHSDRKVFSRVTEGLVGARVLCLTALPRGEKVQEELISGGSDGYVHFWGPQPAPCCCWP